MSNGDEVLAIEQAGSRQVGLPVQSSSSHDQQHTEDETALL